jgi:MFS family permease
MPRLVRALLLAVPLLDELTIGLLTIGLPLLRDRFHLDYAQIGLLFAAGGVSSLVIEPPLNLLSDRGSKRPLILGGMAAVAAAFLLIGGAPNFALLLLGFLLLWPAIGAASIAQSELIDAAPALAERTMTRWTLLASVGDLLTPLGLAVAGFFRLGWTALCVASAALWLAAAVAMLRRRFPATPSQVNEDDAPDESPGLLVGLRLALADRILLRWIAILFLADMMDEVFVAFGGLYLHDRLGYSISAVSLLLGVDLVASLLALLALDHLAGKSSTLRLLPWMALAALLGVALLLLGGGAPPLAAAGFFLCGAGASGWYPLAKAAAYARFPGRTGAVRAILGLGEPFNILLPALTGLIATEFGIAAAVLFLGLSGVGVLLAFPRPTGAYPPRSIHTP